MAETRLAVAENDQSQAFILLKDGIDFFIDSYEKAMKEVEGKNPKIVKITSSQVKQWAETIRRDGKQEEQEKPKGWRRKRPQTSRHRLFENEGKHV